MPKRKASKISNEKSEIENVHLETNIEKESSENADIEIPDLSKINIDEIENTIFEAVKRNNLSNAKAKYLIKQMLKHPSVIEWFRNTFSSNNAEWSLSYEPRVTRGSKRKTEDDTGKMGSSPSLNRPPNLNAGLIGRLLLSAPTIATAHFDVDDCTDIDYLPDSEQSDSDDSSCLTEGMVDESEPAAPPSPYLTRSRRPPDTDFDVDLLEEIDECDDDDYVKVVNEDLSLEQMYSLMDNDVDSFLYDDFKRSLFVEQPLPEVVEDDPEFDVFAQLDDLDEDILDDCRDDRSVRIPKSELWLLLRDNNLVEDGGDEHDDGRESISSAKKKVTLIPADSSCSEIGEAERARLSRQTAMFYQLLATAHLLLYDSRHQSALLGLQEMLERLPTPAVNRTAVEAVLRDYRGLSAPPTVTAARRHKRAAFPRCLLATMLCSPAFPHKEILPTAFRLYPHEDRFPRPSPFLTGEDRLLALGLPLFSGNFRILHRLMFPIRSGEQLRYRKSNLVRRCPGEDGEALLQSSATTRVYSPLAMVPAAEGSLWQRQSEWGMLPEVYQRFLRAAVPETMLQLGLCSSELYARLRRAARQQTDVRVKTQMCNWAALPWETEIQPVQQSLSPLARSKRRAKRPRATLRKVVHDKSYPQYEIPKDSTFRRLLHKWNCLFLVAPSEAASSKPAVPAALSAQRRAAFLVRRARIVLSRARSRTAAVSRLCYAHYYRTEDTEKLFPESAFLGRLEELMAHKKSLRLLRFHDKCRLKDGDIGDSVDTSAVTSNRDEDDLRFCRALLRVLEARMSHEQYEKCLEKLYHFHLDEADPNSCSDVLDLMKYLIGAVKESVSDVDLFEDLLSLLTPSQAANLGLEIEYNKVKNFNQLYSIMRTTRNGNSRRFWIRLCTLIEKVNQRIYPISRVTLYLTNNLKHNPYLQSLIAPLLNCWETPFPNFPETFANYDFLATETSWPDCLDSADTDCWEYCSDLAEPSKSVCGCRCHQEDGAVVRHCVRCGLKVANGSLFVDEGKLHKRPVRVKWPPGFPLHSSELSERRPSLTTEPSISVRDFLRNKGARGGRLTGRCISVRGVPCRLPRPKDVQVSSPCPPGYTQVLRDDEAAMDTDLFRLVKGDCQPPPPPAWTEQDNLRLLSECRRSGPLPATFARLQRDFFPGHSVAEVEGHFNLLFQQLLEYRKAVEDPATSAASLAPTRP